MISMDMNIQNTHLSLSLCRLKKIKIRRIFKYMATMASLSLLIIDIYSGYFCAFFLLQTQWFVWKSFSVSSC